MSRATVVLRQTRLEQRAFWRNPETAFFTFALPIGLLLIFGATSAHDAVPGRPDLDGLTLFVPGILAFGIIVAAYGSLAATIAILRSEGVLKRIRATPLTPASYLAGHLTSVLATSFLIAVTTIVLGRIAFDVAPRTAAVVSLPLTLVLGITCFAALGLAISTVIPNGTASGAITNGTYIPIALVSGTFSTGLAAPALARRHRQRVADQGAHRRAPRGLRPRRFSLAGRRPRRAGRVGPHRRRGRPSLLPVGAVPLSLPIG